MGLAASAAEIRMVVVTNDLVIAKDTTLNVRLIVRASQVTIDGQGSMLHGPGAAENLASPEQAGVGILVEGCVNVTIRNLRVRGFATGLVVRSPLVRLRRV